MTSMDDAERFYYFQVGEPPDDEPADLIAMDGKLVPDNDDASRVRKFATVRAANEFHSMMDGRYAGRPLRLLSTAKRTAHR